MEINVEMKSNFIEKFIWKISREFHFQFVISNILSCFTQWIHENTQLYDFCAQFVRRLKAEIDIFYS